MAKSTKKLLSLFLAMIMVLSLIPAVSAAETDGTEPEITETVPAATEPAATEPTTEPEAPATFDFVIVPVVAIAAAAAGAVVLKKKEN